MARQVLVAALCTMSVPFLTSGARIKASAMGALDNALDKPNMSMERRNGPGFWLQQAFGDLGGHIHDVRQVKDARLRYPRRVASPHPSADGNIMVPSTYWVFVKEVPLVKGIGNFAWHHEVVFCLKNTNVQADKVNQLIKTSIRSKAGCCGMLNAGAQHYMDKDFLHAFKAELPQCFTTTFGSGFGAELAGGSFGTDDPEVYGHENFGTYWIYVGVTRPTRLYSFVIKTAVCGNFVLPSEYLLLHNNCNYYAKAVVVGQGLPIRFTSNSVFESPMLPEVGSYDVSRGRCLGMKCTYINHTTNTCDSYCTWNAEGSCV